MEKNITFGVQFQIPMLIFTSCAVLATQPLRVSVSSFIHLKLWQPHRLFCVLSDETAYVKHLARDSYVSSCLNKCVFLPSSPIVNLSLIVTYVL